MTQLFKSLLIVFLIQFSFTATSIAQTKPEKIDELMGMYSEYGQFNGSVLVAKNGRIIYKAGHGYANMEWNIENQADTKHRLGSVTKQFTAMLILQQVELGNLKLDLPISTYLPSYPKNEGTKITLHHLLTHTSGVPNYTAFPGFFENDSRDPYTPEEFIEVFTDSTLDFEPGSKFSYSNSGYFLLGLILETITGDSYEELLHKQILEPLKMSDTGFDHHETILKNRATGYEKDNGGNYINSSYLDMSIPYSAGAMYSTVEDLFLWDQGLRTNQLISEETKELMYSPHIESWGGHYGYGWGIGESEINERKLRVISHGGGINGFNTLIERIPEDGVLVLLLNNTGRAQLSQMSTTITAILYGQEYELPKKSLAMELLDVVRNKGLQQGMIWYKKTKDNDEYSLIEDEINVAGYTLLNDGKVKESIAIFTINTDEFPLSSNAYDSLGEAYLMDGNKKQALKNYKKSLELDSENTNALEIIRELEN